MCSIKILGNDSIKIITRRVKYYIAASMAAHKYHRKREQIMFCTVWSLNGKRLPLKAEWRLIVLNRS